jgi:hypothetical protein
MLSIGVATEGEEVIPVEDDVDAQFLGHHGRCPHLCVIPVLGLDLDGNADGSGHAYSW